MPQYRVAIIGCGSIANMHVTGYEGVEEVDLVAIADPVEEALEAFGEKHGIKARYTDFRQMLREEKIDIVSNCTWHRLHAPVTVAACAAGPKAVLCEKPMATSLGACDEMIIAAQRNDVKLAIAHQRRFNPVWTEARRLVVEEGVIGDVRHITAVGGQGLLNDCSHLLDMMRYVTGDPAAQWVMGNVERKTERYERDVPIEDRSAGIIQFDNGAIGQLLQELGGRHYQGGIFYGTDGVLELDERKIRLINGGSGGWEDRYPEGEDPSVGQVRELVAWMEGRGEHRGRAENARAAIEIIMAIYESARRHEVVSMPLLTHSNPLEVMIESGDLPVERPGPYDIRAFLLKGEAMQPEGSVRESREGGE